MSRIARLTQPHLRAEVVTGSTRMKSGTAQKMVLNCFPPP
jgi:N-acetylmuramic acid 6-phosphate (MurNAc-6-P) etherase